MLPVKLSFGPYRTDVVELKGGVNENVGSIELQPGELIECRNYMIAEGGYGGYISTKGYEQIDGKVIPSNILSYIIKTTGWVNAPAIGEELTCVENAEVLTVLEVHPETLTLEVSRPLSVASTCSAGDSLTRVSEDPLTISTIKPLYGGTVDYHAALDAAYALVQEVPGEGPVLGVHVFKGKIYAFRKHIGTATVGMYVEHPTTGWAEVTQTTPLTYSAGNHKFHFTNYNFLATSSSYSFYFCDTVNKAREFDGTNVNVVNNAGMGADDKPINIIAINNILFLAYAGGSLQGSTIGAPLDWTTAPVEFGLGNEIRGLTPGVNSTLVIHLKQGIRILNGTNEENFELITFSEDSGAIEYTTQRLLGTIFFLSDQGLTTMEAVTEFGDYAANSISQKFKNTLQDRKAFISVAVTSRDLNQYRLFFNDGKAIYVSFEGKELRGATLVEFRHKVLTAAYGENTDGSDLIVFTSDTGYVYKMDSGKSFNGDFIVARMVTAFYHYKAVRNFKRFKRATFEIFGENAQEVYVKCLFDYQEPLQPAVEWELNEVFRRVGSAVWGSTIWGTMVWGGSSTATSRVPYYINGLGTNMAYIILSREKYREQHVVQNIITDYELCGRRT